MQYFYSLEHIQWVTSNSLLIKVYEIMNKRNTYCKKKWNNLQNVWFVVDFGNVQQEHYTCTNCGNSYQAYSSLQRHMRYECGRRNRKRLQIKCSGPGEYKCERCNRSYHKIYTLQRHIKYQCDKAPSISCSVENCTYKAKLPCRMKAHLRMVHKMEQWLMI